jgi:hypothetical protein
MGAAVARVQADAEVAAYGKAATRAYAEHRPVPPPPDIAAPPTADPPPDDPTDTDAQLRWLLRQAHVGLAQAKPGTQAHTSALKASRELQEALAAHASASSAPPPMDPADARAHLRDLAARQAAPPRRAREHEEGGEAEGGRRVGPARRVLQTASGAPGRESGRRG